MAIGDNKSQFKFSEIFNNSDGKTSGSGFIGVIMGMVATVSFASAIVGWFLGKPEVSEVFGKILQLGLLSAALLGVRKISGVLMNNKNTTEIESKVEIQKTKLDKVETKVNQVETKVDQVIDKQLG